MSLKLTYLILLCSCFCFAQENKISGKVQDNHDSPIAYANIILVNKADDSKILGTITNDTGYFVIKNIETGTYNLEISFVGYSSYSTELVIDKVLFLNSVVLKEISPEELEVIEVIIEDVDK
ncbi:carboxypeptidase-like regulatory domain-containing protein [Formosa undariae]|uniref:Carboxypeptidase-like regulatory domain-containing protein n=1 Tax=Formosa undariae TaxID=1325436 RepID=A0ABV5EXX8_9FLAO